MLGGGAGSTNEASAVSPALSRGRFAANVSAVPAFPAGIYRSIEPGNRLHLRLQGKGVFGEGKDRTYGTLMHRILSQIETLDRVDDTIAAFVRSGELSESESKSIREDINRWLADERVSSWFSPGVNVWTEREILQPDGSFYRPDRVVETDNEVIIPQMMTTYGTDFHVGDTITWQIGERLGADGRIIQHQQQIQEDRNSEDGCEKETIQVEQTKTYTIVGISTNPGYQNTYEPCFLVLTTGVQTTISDIYLKTKSIDDTSDFIAENFGDHQSKTNETLLRYFGQGVSDIRYMLFGMCAVLMVVVAIASIALIYNSFSISLTERTRQFGLFKSIGATRFQVIVSVFLEAGFLAVSAIPAGLLIGCVGVSCVFRLLKNSFDAMIN